MSRLVYSVLFAFSVSVVSISSVGCSESNEVIEDTRTEAEIEKEEADYEAQMEDSAASTTNE